MSHFSQGKYCAGWQRGNPHPQKTDKDRQTQKDRHGRKTEKRQDNRHKQGKTDERDWKRKEQLEGKER